MINSQHISTIGVDLGGTKVRSGRVLNGRVEASHQLPVPKGGSVDEVIRVICTTIDEVFTPTVKAIGVGVPSVVDIDQGIVYDVQNIPSWKEVALKKILENKYNVEVAINNDVNCFALGENYYGIGREYDNFVALIIGTGMAAGVIIDNKIYNGSNCGAGEFGMISYLEHNYEYYCSGQFFTNVHQQNGESVYFKAKEGDAGSLDIYVEFGTHLGNAIKTILYALDPEIIIMGGSVASAYPFFKRSLWESIDQFAYSPALEKLKIEQSTNTEIAVLGAATLNNTIEVNQLSRTFK